jgi:hypothetical protein
MLRTFVIGAACGLALAALSSPSMALDTLMLPNSLTASTPNAAALTQTPDDKKDAKSSWHFSVSGNSGGYAGPDMFLPGAFGPNSDRSNPMGPMKTYGPPTSQDTSDPFFHN